MYSRRSFLYLPTAAASSAFFASGANDRLNVGVVGLGGRGGVHMELLMRQPNTKIGAVCDVNQAAQERAVALVEKTQGHKGSGTPATATWATRACTSSISAAGGWETAGCLNPW